MKEIILTTNGKLTSDTVSALSKVLSRKLGCERVRHEADPSIIGGFTVKYDGTFYDLSVRCRLEMLRRHVEEAEAAK